MSSSIVYMGNVWMHECLQLQKRHENGENVLIYILVVAFRFEYLEDRCVYNIIIFIVYDHCIGSKCTLSSCFDYASQLNGYMLMLI